MPPQRFGLERRPGARRDNRQPNQRSNQRNRGFEQRGGFDWLFGDDFNSEIRPYGPATNKALTLDPMANYRYREVGVTAGELKMEHERVQLKIDESAPTVRLDEDSPGNTSTVEELENQELTVEREGDLVTIEGKMAPLVGTALIVRDAAGTEKIWAFNKPELETFGRGESGPVGLLQGLPGQQMLKEIDQEYVGIAREKSSGEEVLVAVDTGEPRSLQTQRVVEGKTRLLAIKRQRLATLFQRKGANRQQFSLENDQINRLTKPHRIVFIPKQPIPSAVADEMKTVTTEINGQHETIKAHVRFDEQRPTIIQPVYIEPEASSIDMSTLTFLDARGERQCYPIDSPSRSQTEYLREIARTLGRPQLVQRESQGEIFLPPPLAVQAWSNPTAVLSLGR